MNQTYLRTKKLVDTIKILTCPICSTINYYFHAHFDCRFPVSDIDEQRGCWRLVNEKNEHLREISYCRHSPTAVSYEDMQTHNVQFTLSYSVDKFKCPICNKENTLVGDFTKGHDSKGGWNIYNSCAMFEMGSMVEKVAGVTNDVCKHYNGNSFGPSIIFEDRHYTEIPFMKRMKEEIVIVNKDSDS